METKIIKRLKSKLKQHYWNNNGAYQKEYDELWDRLVPSSGEAETIHGELVRSIGRLYYEYCNNGNCNVFIEDTETCPECDGEGYEEERDCYSCDGDGYIYDEDEEEDIECEDCSGVGIEEREDCHYCGGHCEVPLDKLEWVSHWRDYAYFLEEYMEDSTSIEELVDWLESNPSLVYNYKYSDNEMSRYDKVVDEVIYQCLTTENAKNPYYKEGVK